MTDILEVIYPILAWSALIGGISAIATGIHGLIITKRENENRLEVNNFTDATLKDGDELERSVFDFNKFYYWMDTLDIVYPQFVFVDEFDVKRNETLVHIYNENRSRKLASLRFKMSDIEYNPDACIDKIIDWCSNYIPQKTCCENRLELKPMKAMTCEKCGAPLKSCECEYCGTRYYIPNNDTLAQTKQELSQAQFDAANRVKSNEIQNMVDRLRMLGGNGSIEHMLSSGAVNIATARDMYAVKMASCFSDYGGLL